MTNTSGRAEPHKTIIKLLSKYQAWQVLVEAGGTVQLQTAGNGASSSIRQHD